MSELKSTKHNGVVLLIRRIVYGKAVWILHSQHANAKSAERYWEATIRGRGVTAWSWWGPRRVANKMLFDPQYNPDKSR